jgi:hypothetical protein
MEGDHDMTSCDDRDAGVDGLKRLMVLTPDPDRAARVLVQCRAQLEHRRPGKALMARAAWRALPPIGIALLCVVYVVVLVATTLRLEGIVP